MIVWLVRHTTPNIAPGVCYGQSEVGLAASYQQELATLKATLAGRTFAACFSSPLQRCRQLAEDVGQKPIIDKRLMELNFGAWELKRWDAIDRTKAAYWGDHFVTEQCPGGESFTDLAQRATAFWQDLAVYASAKHVLVVTHGGVIRALLAQLRGLSLDRAFEIEVACGQVIGAPWQRLQPPKSRRNNVKRT